MVGGKSREWCHMRRLGLGKSNQFEVLASDEQRDKSIMSLNKYGRSWEHAFLTYPIGFNSKALK
jgi:hypothetical protein